MPPPAVGGGVSAGEFHPAFAEFDAGDALEGGRGGEREESTAAVGVDEETRATGGGLGADVTGEGGEDEGVVLEKIAGEEAEFQFADSFGDDGFVVVGHDPAGVAQQEGRAAGEFTGGGTGVDAGADRGEFFVDGVGRDGAARNVDDVEARALAQKTDGHRAGGAS